MIQSDLSTQFTCFVKKKGLISQQLSAPEEKTLHSKQQGHLQNTRIRRLRVH